MIFAVLVHITKAFESRNDTMNSTWLKPSSSLISKFLTLRASRTSIIDMALSMD